jgi:apolipoprotein N-acyltransferase
MMAAAVYFALYFTPIGDVTNPGYTQVENSSVMMLSSLFGINFVNFLLHWVAALAHYFTLKDETKYSRVGLRSIVAILLLLLCAGSLMHEFHEGRIYQTPLSATVHESIPVSCLYGQHNKIEEMVKATNEVLKQVPKPEVILWSEVSTLFNTSAEEAALTLELSDLAKSTSTMIGFAFGNFETGGNVFVLLSNKGEVLIKYAKAHPVPIVEAMVIPGPKVLQVADTSFGRLGASICFDLDYPNFVHQASQKGVDILLQPSWTWGSIGRYHALINHVRAIENGFYLFRCSSVGYSGVFGPDHTKYSFEPKLKSGSFSTTLPLAKRSWTLYGIVGESFSWISVVLSVLLFALAALSPRQINTVAKAKKS